MLMHINELGGMAIPRQNPKMKTLATMSLCPYISLKVNQEDTLRPGRFMRMHIV